MNGINAYAEDITKVAGDVYAGKLCGYVFSLVRAPRNTCIPPIAVVVHGFPYEALDAHRDRQQPLLTARFAQFVEKFEVFPIRTRVIFECLQFALASVGEGNRKYFPRPVR